MKTKCVVCLQDANVYNRLCDPCKKQGITPEQACNLVVERRGICSDRELVAALSHATSLRRGWQAHAFRMYIGELLRSKLAVAASLRSAARTATMRKELYEKLGGKFEE